MKAIEIRQWGLEHLTLTERREREPGPGEAVVRVHGTALNYRDLLMARGQYNPKQKLPLIPLSDGAGVVESVGAGVTRVKPGDRVAATFVQGLISPSQVGDEEALRRTRGGPLDGMLAEKVVLPAEDLVKTPEHLSAVEAATLPCAALTAWNALVSYGHLAPGDTIVVQGTGGVSIFALQFGAMMGARVIAISSSDAKLERAKSLGASDLVNYKSQPEWGKEVRALTGGRGADLVVEVGGAGTLGQSVRAVRAGGQISIIGMLAGGRGEVDVTPILMRGIRLQGVFTGTRDDFERMNRAIAHKKLKPVMDRVFPLAETRAAFEALAKAEHLGKIGISLE
jgi:NADPH:quinone reductase-like Zn-dependent oxidoreductase